MCRDLGWGGSKAIVPIVSNRCPRCGSAEMHPQTITEQPLLRHGGYGAARETVTLYCALCPYYVTTSVGETRPT